MTNDRQDTKRPGAVPFDVDKARAETPGCTSRAHFNSCGASLMPTPVLEALHDHIELEAQLGGYEAEDRRQAEITDTYRALADLVDCRPEEIAVVESATRAWDMAFYAIPLGPRDRVLVSATEYGSNFLGMLQRCNAVGASLELIPDAENGTIDIDELAAMLDERVRIVCVTHIPTDGGLINPAAEVGNLIRDTDITYVLDAAQSVGHLPIDVQELGCDVLIAPGRKFLRGPRGTGFLYMDANLLRAVDPPLVDLHAAEWVADREFRFHDDGRRFETWESNCAAKLGLGVAARYAQSWGTDVIWGRISELAATLREALAEVAGVTIRDRGAEPCGIVSFTINEVTPTAARSALDEQGISVMDVSSSYARIDMGRRDLSGVVRASVHYYNVPAEIERLCRGVYALTAQEGYQHANS